MAPKGTPKFTSPTKPQEISIVTKEEKRICFSPIGLVGKEIE